MASDYDSVELGEVASVRSGFAFKSSDWTDSGVPVVKIANVKDGCLVMDGCSFVAPRVAALASEFALQAGDILIAMTGYIGDVALVRERDLPVALNQRVGRFSVRDPHRLDPRFLFYLLRDDDVRKEIEGLGYGSAQPNISPSLIHGIEIPLPPLPEQCAIARILGALDDKIELNRRMNETLEAMARALFKSWFIDFDPVRAKAEGRDPGLPADIAALFPDSFQDSDLGEIPEGWKVQPFSDIVDIIGGGTPKTTVPEYWGGDIPWFSVVDDPRATDVWVVDTEKKITQEGVEMSSTRILPVGTTIISARGTVGKLALVGVPMAMNQSCYGLQGKAEGSSSFTYYSTRRLVAVLQQHAHGSVFDTITRDTLAGVSIPVPPANVAQAFEFRVSPIVEQLRATLFESRTLAALRNTLLPKLLSGEIQVVEVSPFGGHVTHAEGCPGSNAVGGCHVKSGAAEQPGEVSNALQSLI